MIVGLAVMTSSIFLGVFLTIGIVRIFSFGSFWQASPDFPKAASEPFIWAISSLLGNGAAIFMAEKIRSRRLKKQRWFVRAGANLKRNPANYVLIAVLSGVAGFCMFYVWSALLFGSPSGELAVLVAPFSLLPAMTGAFYVFHLDGVDLNSRPSRALELGAQALATGFCGFAAASAANALGGSDVVIDFALFYATIGIVIGASLAWYIPNAAAANKFDPLAEVLEARIASLKAAALKKFGSEDAAEHWVEQAHPQLNNRPPKSVVADIGMFEKAVALLNAA